MEYKISRQFWGSMFGFPISIVEDHIKLCSGNALKIILLAFKMGDTTIGIEQIAKTLGISKMDVEDGISYWVENNMLERVNQADASAVTKAASAPEIALVSKRPRYTRDEVNQMFEDNKDLRGLLEEAQNILNKLLKPVDLEILLSLYDYQRYSLHFIMTVMHYCACIHKTSMSYVETTAREWFARGIDDDTINNHMENLLMYHSNEGRIKRLLGIKDRALKANEKEKLNRWCSEYQMSDELILYAYQATIERTGKMTFKYQDTILARWHNNKITTLEQARLDIEVFVAQNKSTISGNKANQPYKSRPTDPSDPYNMDNIEALLEGQFSGTEKGNTEDSMTMDSIEKMLELQFAK